MRMRTSKELQDRLQELFPVHYRNGNILMINADCMDVMKHIKEKEVELSCVDPPYRDENQPTKEMRNKINGKMKEFGKKPDQKYFNELFRISKNQIIWGGNNFIEHLKSTNCMLFWYKKNPMENYSDGEFAWTSFNTVSKCIPINHFGAHNADGKNIIHPTQKPVALYKWLLSRYAKPGDKILDTHGGSGSICIACHDLGYDLTWMELDEDYYKAAVERYQNHAAQATLFDPAELTKATETTPELFSDGSEAEE